tara:strand:- start:384 stop:599 length:216 start_codon:yes stop_codon:yes gene_type:complete
LEPTFKNFHPFLPRAGAVAAPGRTSSLLLLEGGEELEEDGEAATDVLLRLLCMEEYQVEVGADEEELEDGE